MQRLALKVHRLRKLWTRWVCKVVCVSAQKATWATSLQIQWQIDLMQPSNRESALSISLRCYELLGK
jgi:hypothetical protein